MHGFASARPCVVVTHVGGGDGEVFARKGRGVEKHHLIPASANATTRKGARPPY